MRKKIAGIYVEWDENKSKKNLRDHKISFETAAMVFADDFRIELPEYRNGEQRYRVLGMVGKVLFVVYTQRGDCSRIISARIATSRERKAYYGNS